MINYIKKLGKCTLSVIYNRDRSKAMEEMTFCRIKQSNKEKSQSFGTGQERMLLLQNES